MENVPMVPNGKGEKDVSLLDLVIIVIASRRTVIWTTLIGAVLAAIVIFALPLIGIDLLAKPKYVITTTINVAPWPREIQMFEIPDVSSYMVGEMTDLKRVGSIYQDVFYDISSPPANVVEYYTELSRGFLKNDYDVKADVSRMLIRVSVSSLDQERSTQFIKKMYTAVSTDLQNLLNAYLKQVVSRLKYSLEEMERTPFGKIAREESLRAYVDLKTQLEVIQRAIDTGVPSTTWDKNFTITKETGISHTGVFWVALGSSFIFALILVFLIHGLKSAQNNPELLNRLKRAWRGE